MDALTSEDPVYWIPALVFLALLVVLEIVVRIQARRARRHVYADLTVKVDGRRFREVESIDFSRDH